MLRSDDAQMSTTTTKTVIGTFTNSARAQVALDRLFAAGFTDKNLSVMVSEGGRATHFAIDKGNKAAEGAAGGGALGTAVGALVAGLSAVSAIVIPGLGVFAVGPLIAALAGGGAGAAAGGIIGGLVGLGFDEHEAKLVQKSLEDGHIIVGVQTRDKHMANKAKRVFEEEEADSLAV